MIERQILQVVYSPFKAFEEIVKNPAAKGSLLVLALGVITAAITGYVSSSKVNVQLESELGPYVPLVTTEVFGGRMLAIVMDSALRLSLIWFIYSGVMLLVIKVFGGGGGSWRTLFFVIGYTLMATVVYTLVSALLISALPVVNLKWGVWNPTPEMEEMAYNERLIAYGSWFSSPIYQFASYLYFVVEGWTGVLAAIAVHALLGVTWRKAIGIAVTASVLAFMLRIVLLSL